MPWQHADLKNLPIENGKRVWRREYFRVPDIPQIAKINKISMENESIKISLVIPCFNESQGVAKTLDEILVHTSKLNGLEIIFVNDGSTDDTGKFLSNEKTAEISKAQYLENQFNQGYGASLKRHPFCQR